VLLLAAFALPFVLSSYRTFQFTLVLVYAIALLGLNILTGYNGQISLGHGAFYAIGAYAAAILMDRYGFPYWATVPIAGGLCLVVGFLFGCRRCASKATTWRSRRSRSASRCRNC
jgi:branched-chain amino acid transport system permease protein